MMDHLRIGHDGSGPAAGWFLEEVVVENLTNASAECVRAPSARG